LTKPSLVPPTRARHWHAYFEAEATWVRMPRLRLGSPPRAMVSAGRDVLLLSSSRLSTSECRLRASCPTSPITSPSRTHLALVAAFLSPSDEPTPPLYSQKHLSRQISHQDERVTGPAQPGATFLVNLSAIFADSAPKPISLLLRLHPHVNAVSP